MGKLLPTLHANIAHLYRYGARGRLRSPIQDVKREMSSEKAPLYQGGIQSVIAHRGVIVRATCWRIANGIEGEVRDGATNLLFTTQQACIAFKRDSNGMTLIRQRQRIITDAL